MGYPCKCLFLTFDAITYKVFVFFDTLDYNYVRRKETMRVVLITGASSGVGKATAETFVANGDKVYGVARRDFKLDGVETILGDITSNEDIKRIVGTIIDKEGHIDVLVNNAGMGISGAIEFCDIDNVIRQMDVNFLGAVRLTQQVLPYMRKNNGGMIINVSSIAGFVPIPYQAYYSASKSALESWALALRTEVKPFGIKVAVIQPGDIKTGFTSARIKSVGDTEGVYEARESKSIAKMEKDEQHGMSPYKVAKVVLKVSKRKNPAPTKTVGALYKFLSILIKFLPRRLVLWVVSKMY